MSLIRVYEKNLFFVATFLFLIFFLLGCWGPSLKEFQKIADLLNSKQYNSAISNLNELNLKYPSNARIYYYLGYAYLNNKDYIRALKNLNASLELKPDFKWVIGDTTLANFLAGNSTGVDDVFFKTAVRELQKIIEDNKGKELSDEIRYHLAVLFLIKKDYESSIKELQNIINKDPKNIFDAKAHLKIGDIYINYLDNPGKGIKEYREVISKYGKAQISVEASLKIATSIKDKMHMYKERYLALKKFLNNWKGVKEMEKDIKLAEVQSLQDLNKARELRTKAEKSFKEIIKNYPNSIFKKKAEDELSEIEKDFHDI